MAVNPLDAFAQGQGLVNSFATQLGQRQAGRALAQGDYASAMSSLFNSGDIGGGLQLQGLQQQQQELQRSRQDEQRKRQVQFTMQATKALRGAVQEGQDPIAVYDSFQPAFQALGVAPEELGQYRQALAANPAAFLDTVEQAVGQAARELEIVNYGSGRGAVAVDKNTGEIVNEFGPAAEPIKVGDVLLDPVTYEPILDAREPRYQTVTNTDGSTSVVAIDQPAPIRGTGGGSNDLAGIKQRLFAREGGYVARDGSSGAPANFGINQRANPDVDVANLTQERAEQIYDERYIKPILDAGVSGPALEAVIDFGVNAGPNLALDFWRRSGGDINRFNELRLKHYRGLPDYNRYGRSWERRVAETTPGTVDTRGGTRVVAQGENRGPQVTQLSPQEVAALNLPEGTVAQRRADGSINVVSKGGSERYTEGQRQAAGFAYRLNNAAGTLNRLAQAGTARPSPAILAFGEGRIRENALSSTDRRWLQAAREWLAPVLRKDTGAAVGPGELVTYMGIYLPSPTDDPATLAQKAQARQVAEQALRAQAGGAYAEMFPQAAQPQQRRRAQTNTGGVIPFNLSQQQLARWRELGRSGGDPSAPLGSTRNPRWINEAAAGTSYNNIPRGSYYFDPNGQMRRKN